VGYFQLRPLRNPPKFDPKTPAGLDFFVMLVSIPTRRRRWARHDTPPHLHKPIPEPIALYPISIQNQHVALSPAGAPRALQREIIMRGAARHIATVEEPLCPVQMGYNLVQRIRCRLAAHHAPLTLLL
jgi:hypothetical protein